MTLIISEVFIFLTSSICLADALGTMPSMKSSSKDWRSPSTASISSMLNCDAALAPKEASLRSTSRSSGPDPAKGSSTLPPSRSVIPSVLIPPTRESPNISESRFRSEKVETTEFC